MFYFLGRIIDEKADMQQQNSKLEDAKRRRLSVSTVRTHEDIPSPRTTSIAQLKAGLSNLSTDSTKHVDSLGAESTVETEDLVMKTSIQSKIKKFPDPALELLNERTGSIRDVTVEMIMELVSASTSTYMMFGMPSEDVQRGFDVRS